jgi:hypothetical protein
MLLVIDRDNNLSIHASVRDAEGHLETIDIEDGEYQFCDEHGQPYVGEILKPVGKFSSGQFRIVPHGTPDPTLPLALVSRSTDYRSKVPGLKTREDALSYFASRKT